MKLHSLMTGMAMRLWNYVSTFSNLSGERLHEIYSKLKEEQAEMGAGPSHRDGSSGPFDKDESKRPFGKSRNLRRREPAGTSLKKGDQSATAKSAAWKRRRRAPVDSAWDADGSNFAGILGSGPLPPRPSRARSRNQRTARYPPPA